MKETNDNLFPYQEIGAEFLSKRRYALLADEMGLGKTVQAIRGLDIVNAYNVLVITPSIARVNWHREFEKWSQIKRKYKVLVKLADTPMGGVNICSFDYATQNYKKLNKINWDALVVDECHFLKSPKTKRAKAIIGRNGIAHKCKRIWLMSGTPAPNNPSELWIPLFIFGITKMNYEQFINYFCVTRPTSYGIKIVGADRTKTRELRYLLSKIMLRRNKLDVLSELPPLNYYSRYVEPGLVDFEITGTFAKYFFPVDRRQDLFNDIKNQEKLIKALDVNTKYVSDEQMLYALSSIQQSVSAYRRYIGLQKVDAVAEIINQTLKYRGSIKKVVIFAIHRDVIEGLRVKLREHKPVILYGGIDPKKRQRNIDRFQNDPKYKVFIGNIMAAGTAVTLTAAHNVYFIEQDWTPGNNAQAVMRCHRIGQENPVSVTFFCLDDPIDTRLTHILKRKVKDITAIFD